MWWLSPLRSLPTSTPHPINKMSTQPLRMQVGQDAYVLGYPFGIGPLGLPVWKRASFATEPDAVDPNDPYILLDSASKSGMSGSPIIQRSWGQHLLEDGGALHDGLPGTRFVGVYSGRISSDDPNDPQLGMGWPAFLLREILAGRKVDK